MSVLAEAAHKAARCPFTNIWCHEPAAQRHHDLVLEHKVATVVVALVILAVVIALIRWRGKRKSASTSRRQTTPYSYR